MKWWKRWVGRIGRFQRIEKLGQTIEAAQKDGDDLGVRHHSARTDEIQHVFELVGELLDDLEIQKPRPALDGMRGPENLVLDQIPEKDRPIFYFMQEYGVRRITSYNVCYTKLLRHGIAPLGLALGLAPPAPAAPWTGSLVGWIARNPKITWRELWPELGYYGNSNRWGSPRS